MKKNEASGRLPKGIPRALETSGAAEELIYGECSIPSTLNHLHFFVRRLRQHNGSTTVAGVAEERLKGFRNEYQNLIKTPTVFSPPSLNPQPGQAYVTPGLRSWSIPEELIAGHRNVLELFERF